jgi:hypothetical protein
MTIWRYRIPKLILKASDEVLAHLDALYAHVALVVYGIRLPAHAFTASVRDMRLSVRALYSPRGIKRSLLGFVERLVKRHSRAQAASHRADVLDTCDFDNHEGRVWVDPVTGELSVENFEELFEKAEQAALSDLRLHEEGAPSALITKNLSFEGIPVASPLP